MYQQDIFRKVSVLLLLVLASQLVQQSFSYQVPGCYNYYNSGYCYECLSGYINRWYTCCQNQTSNCLQCYYQTSSCSSCISSHCLNASYGCQFCNITLSNCIACSSCNSCITCVNTHYLVNSTTKQCQTCQNFMPYCLNCTSSRVCVTCVANPKVLLVFSKCLLCTDIMFQCQTCVNSSYCTKCNDYFALNITGNNSKCSLCSDFMENCKNCSSSKNCTKCIFGQIVNYGCSSVPGCLQVTHTSANSTCTVCIQPQFIKNPVNGVCVCTKGHLAGKYCTQILGCININRNSTGDYCTSCNNILQFQFQNHKCVCRRYYELKGSECKEICGDGYIINLACDDGNLIDGDGCSSKCQIEKGYTCHRVQDNSKSACVFKARMALSLSCVNNLGGNTASIVLSVTPPISNFAKSNLTDLITLNTGSNCTMTNYSIIGSQLYIFIQFKQNVQQKKVDISLKYDETYIISPISTISFSLVQCHGFYLFYDNSYSQNNKDLITIVVKFICALTWAAWLIGSYSHKMIGVETLHTIQLIFIMQTFASRYSPIVAYFGQLNSVLNGFQRLVSDSPTFSSNDNYYRLTYSQSFLSNMSVAVILQFSSILVYLLLFAIQKTFILDRILKKKSNKADFISKVKKLQVFIWNFLIFPLIIGLFFHQVLSLMIRYSNSQTNAFVAVLIVSLGSLIYFAQWKNIMIAGQKAEGLPRTKEKYIPIYLTNLFLMSIVICLAVLGISTSAIYVIAGAEVFNGLIIIVYRPYKSVIHKKGLIVNQTGILLNVLWIVSQNYVYLKPTSDEIIAFVIMGLMILINIFAFVRSVQQIRHVLKAQKLMEEKANQLKREDRGQKIQKILKNDKQKMIKLFDKEQRFNQSQFLTCGFKPNITNASPLLGSTQMKKNLKKLFK